MNMKPPHNPPSKCGKCNLFLKSPPHSGSELCNCRKDNIATLEMAMEYFNQQVGHFSDIDKCDKLIEEVAELQEAVFLEQGAERIIEEASDNIAIAFHIAVRNGFKGDASDLVIQAYKKMKCRVESGERDYINRDF